VRPDGEAGGAETAVAAVVGAGAALARRGSEMREERRIRSGLAFKAGAADGAKTFGGTKVDERTDGATGTNAEDDVIALC
jgi:uncharacterized protein YfiM (DUF2279 family)